MPVKMTLLKHSFFFLRAGQLKVATLDIQGYNIRNTTLEFDKFSPIITIRLSCESG